MNMEEDRESTTGSEGIVVAAIGDGGCNVLAHIARQPQALPGLVAINTEPLASLPARVRCLQIGRAVMRGMGTGGDPRVGRRAAEHEADAIRGILEEARLLFLIVGLGGGTGTGGAPIVLDMAREAGVLTLCFAMLPFEFEGARRMDQAKMGLSALRAAADGVICMPNERLFKDLQDQTNIAGAFARADEMISEGICAIWGDLTRRDSTKGIQISFNDLRALLRNGNGDCVFACASAGGQDKADRLLDEIKRNPLLNGGKSLASARAFLISVVGGPDLSLSEVTKIARGLTEECKQDALIKTGVALDESMQDKLFVTVLVSEREESAPRKRGRASVQKEASRDGAGAGMKKTATLDGTAQVSSRPDEKEKWVQADLFESEKTGRFKDSSPTIVEGHNLDIPTFKRRGILIQNPRNNS